MIVPQYWAEARLQHRNKNRHVTVRRFGWSDASQAEAQLHADSRCREALDRILAGDPLPRRDPKVPYNGADGLPIREEIVSRHGTSIITRNAYGARCLNSPHVLFADIDFAVQPSFRFSVAIYAGLLLTAIALAWQTESRAIFVVAGLLALMLGGTLSRTIYRIATATSGGAEQQARRRIARYLAHHSDWNLRLYRTPAGMRVVATHRLFSPGEPAVTAFFTALAADPVYVRMCINQQCFRARVSAKPWRIGITGHMRPRPGTWPVSPERLPGREQWIAAYESKAGAYAACMFITSAGSGVIHPQVQEVVTLHDELCSATRGLPIA